MQALIDHVVWNLKLRDFLDGKQSLSLDEAVLSKNCNLARWLRTQKESACESNSRIRELKKVHTQLHETVERIIEMKFAGKNSYAKEKLVELKQISVRIIYLLTEIEKMKKGV